MPSPTTEAATEAKAAHEVPPALSASSHLPPTPPPALATTAAVTGVVEDVHMAAALTVDSLFVGLRRFPVELRQRGVWQASVRMVARVTRMVGRVAGAVLGRLLRRVFLRRHILTTQQQAEAARQQQQTVDGSMKTLLASSGYPYERHTTTTADGYILVLDRIPRRSTRHVALFVHGILDSAVAWIGSGPVHALGYRAHDQGCDVWMLNFRYALMSALVPCLAVWFIHILDSLFCGCQGCCQLSCQLWIASFPTSFLLF